MRPFSLVNDDPPLSLQRRLGLVPRGGLGIVRRAVFWVALTWLPIAVWAALTGRALPGDSGTESLLQHFGVHVRLLLGIPLLIVAEGLAHRISQRLTPQFAAAGLVKPEQQSTLQAIFDAAVRWRDAKLPWLVILVAALAWTWADTLVPRTAHELAWAHEGGPSGSASLGFGGWWYVYVARPVFLALLIGWLWRLLLLTLVFRRIARLDLALVPTHADRVGGLGFVEQYAGAFSLVAFTSAAVVSAGWAHDARFHGLDVHSLYPLMATALVATLAVALLPFLAFTGALARTKRQALLDYGALVSRHGKAVRRKWIEGQSAEDDPLLEAPEIGPVADTAALYESVRNMRVVPIGKPGLLALALPVLIPFVAVLAMQIPLRELLQGLVKGLL